MRSDVRCSFSVSFTSMSRRSIVSKGRCTNPFPYALKVSEAMYSVKKQVLLLLSLCGALSFIWIYCDFFLPWWCRWRWLFICSCRTDWVSALRRSFDHFLWGWQKMAIDRNSSSPRPKRHLVRHLSNESSRQTTERCWSYPLPTRSSEVLKKDSRKESISGFQTPRWPNWAERILDMNGQTRVLTRTQTNPGWNCGTHHHEQLWCK